MAVKFEHNFVKRFCDKPFVWASVREAIVQWATPSNELHWAFATFKVGPNAQFISVFFFQKRSWTSRVVTLHSVSWNFYIWIPLSVIILSSVHKSCVQGYDVDGQKRLKRALKRLNHVFSDDPPKHIWFCLDWPVFQQDVEQGVEKMGAGQWV